MDFIEGLPKTHKLDTILVIIDKFTKYGHFYSCGTSLHCIADCSGVYG
jgi:hypothetical protein